MNMKDLKMYEAPASEVVELDVKAQLLAGSVGETNDPNTTVEQPIIPDED